MLLSGLSKVITTSEFIKIRWAVVLFPVLLEALNVSSNEVNLKKKILFQNWFETGLEKSNCASLFQHSTFNLAILKLWFWDGSLNKTLRCPLSLFFLGIYCMYKYKNHKEYKINSWWISVWGGSQALLVLQEASVNGQRAQRKPLHLFFFFSWQRANCAVLLPCEPR